MKSALDIHQALLSRSVRHELVRTRSNAASADDLPRALGVDAQSCVAVRCFVVDGCRTARDRAIYLVAVLVLAGDGPDPISLQRTLGARSVRAATPDEVNLHTGFSSAFVSPVGLPADVVVLADVALGARDVLYAATGESGVALGIATSDLLAASGARLASLTSGPMDVEELAPWGAAPGTVAQRGEDPAARVITLEDRRASARRSVS